MRILCIGDVVGKNGCEFLRKKLPSLKKIKSIDLTICNGENASDGNGITLLTIFLQVVQILLHLVTIHLEEKNFILILMKSHIS